jgi:hypothetical protein
MAIERLNLQHSILPSKLHIHLLHRLKHPLRMGKLDQLLWKFPDDFVGKSSIIQWKETYRCMTVVVLLGTSLDDTQYHLAI